MNVEDISDGGPDSKPGRESHLDSRRIDVLQSARSELATAKDLEKIDKRNWTFWKYVDDQDFSGEFDIPVREPVSDEVDETSVDIFTPLPPRIRFFMTSSGERPDSDNLQGTNRIYITTINTDKFPLEEDHSGLHSADIHLFLADGSEYEYVIHEFGFDLVHFDAKTGQAVKYRTDGLPYEAVHEETGEAMSIENIDPIDPNVELVRIRNLIRGYTPARFPDVDEIED